MIALSFRAVIAVMFAFMGSSKAFYIIAGPVASALSRLVLALFVDKAVYALIAAAVPGMIFTAFAAPLIAGILTNLPVLKRARMPKQT